VYGWESGLESNSVDVHVHRLRRKLHPDVIRTVRGVGYVIDPSPPARAG
jgi:two-component system response regulator QseB